MGGESLVLGIVGMLTWLIPFFGLPIPLIGLIWGIMVLRRKPPKRWMAITGVTLSSIGLSLSLFYSVISVVSPDTTILTTTPSNGAPLVTPPPVSTEWTADGEITPGEYSKTIKLSEGFQIHWSSDAEYIYVAMKALTSGWVSVGLQPDLRMDKDIDLILGFVKGDETTIYDLFSTDQPGIFAQDIVLGGSKDILEFGGAEGLEGADQDDEEGVVSTIIEFKRKLLTGDLYDQPLLDGANTITWAYGPEDSRDSSDTDRGFGVIDL